MDKEEVFYCFLKDLIGIPSAVDHMEKIVLTLRPGWVLVWGTAVGSGLAIHMDNVIATTFWTNINVSWENKEEKKKVIGGGNQTRKN